MKRFLVMLIILIMLMFCGCVNPAKVEHEQTTGTSMFVVVEEGNLWEVVYHRETKVMYTVSRSSYNNGNFCLLVNQDGTPMLWKGENVDGN